MTDKNVPLEKGIADLIRLGDAKASPTKSLREMYRTAKPEAFARTLHLTIGETTTEYKKVQWFVDGEPRGLRYGTNPHQSAALYTAPGSLIDRLEWLKWGKGGPSLTNVQDGARGLSIVSHFQEPAVAVMKHLNPSGVAVGIDGCSLGGTYIRAREADGRAAFGSVVVFNSPVDRETAKEITKTFVEVVYAPDYYLGALREFSRKDNMRIARIPVPEGRRGTAELPSLVSLSDGALILEDSYRTRINSLDDITALGVPTKRAPSAGEYKDMLSAWHVVSEIRSNGVVIWRCGESLGIGTGQVDRIGAIEDALQKARCNMDTASLKGSVMASDGFIPKVDNVEAIAKMGVSAVIQPGGSTADPKVIEACDGYGIAMVFTGERAFRH